MDHLDARSRRSSREVEASYTPRLSARGSRPPAADDSRSLAELAAGFAGLRSQAERVAQRHGEGTRSTLDSVEQMGQSISAAMDSRKVSVAEARRRSAAAGGGPGGGPGGGGGGGGAAAAAVPPADLEAAARAMVDAWLDRRGLVQYAERIIFAFQEAAYRPHEWTHTLETMGADELKEFIAAVEKSPAPNEGAEDVAPARRRSRGTGGGGGGGERTATMGAAPDGLAGTLAEVSRLSAGPKAGRRAGGGVRPTSRETAAREGKAGRRGQGMEVVPRAAAGAATTASVRDSKGSTRAGGGSGGGGGGGGAAGGPTKPRAGRRAAAEAATAAANRGRRAAAMAGSAR
jgi:hypothetical protein